MAVRLGLNRRQKRYLRRHYTPGQRKVIRNIAGEAIRRYAPGGFSTAEKRKIRSAFGTGRIESNLRQLNYGDADSVGWRQERRSLYPDAANLPRSVRRYFNEADQHYRGQAPWLLSADVQRPAAQYRGRYKSARGEAISLLRTTVLGANPKNAPRVKSQPSRAAKGTPQSLKALVAGGPQNTPVAGSTPQDPPFSARAFLRLPEGAGDVPGSDVPGPRGSSSSLGSLAKLLSSTPTTSPVPAPTAQQRRLGLSPGQRLGRGGLVVGSDYIRDGKLYRWDPRQKRYERPGSGKPLPRPGSGGGRGRGGGEYGKPRGTPLGSPIDRPGARTSPRVRRFVQALAGRTGFPIVYGTGTQHSRYSTSGYESQHWRGNAIDLPASGRRLRIMGTKALRQVGVGRRKARQMAFRGGLYNINYRGRRYQIIFRTDTGGNHWDHLHVGIG